MSNLTIDLDSTNRTRDVFRLNLLVLPLLVAIWPFIQSMMIFISHPSAGYSAILIALSMIVVTGKMALDKYRNYDLLHDETNILRDNRLSPLIWSILSVLFSIASFAVPILGHAAMGAAIVAIASAICHENKRSRFAMWFVCFVSPLIFLQSIWQSFWQYANQVTAWATSGFLDIVAFTHLRSNDVIDSGSILYNINSAYSLWNGIETYLALCVSACLVFHRSLLNLGLSLVIAFYWSITIGSCQAVMDIMAPNEITSIVGMNLATASWILVFLGIVGVLVLEQFIAALCSPIFFNTLDTPLPMLTQSLNRFLTFPSIVQMNFQDTQHAAASVACEEYEDISVSDLSATGRIKGGDQVEIVRFQEILERNKRPSSDEREQA